YLAAVDSNRHIFLGGLLPGPLGPEPGAARGRGPGPRDRDRRRGGLGGVALTRRGTDRGQAFRCTCDARRSRAAGRLTRWQGCAVFGGRGFSPRCVVRERTGAFAMCFGERV